MITAKSSPEKYQTEITNGRAMIVADAAAEKSGQGQSFRPHELLCAGLAGCLDITTRMILERKKLAYEQVIVNVTLDDSDESRTRFLYDIEIVGDIPIAVKQQVIKIAGNCPVRKTLSRSIEFAPLLEK